MVSPRCLPVAEGGNEGPGRCSDSPGCAGQPRTGGIHTVLLRLGFLAHSTLFFSACFLGVEGHTVA